jgi:hypothetical protein
MSGVRIRHLENFRVPLHPDQERVTVAFDRFDQPIIGGRRGHEILPQLLDALVMHAVHGRPCGFKQPRQLCVRDDVDLVREVIAREAGGRKKVVLVESRIL